jgi:succinate dehydrogenase / fumarate reductase, cytochrome b subunit
MTLCVDRKRGEAGYSGSARECEALMATATSANPATPTPGDGSPRAQRLRRTLYRGDPGMWSWVLHRITGATIFFFLFVHVLDTALVRISPQTYNEVIGTYKTPIVGLMELGLVAAVLYHALNGIRVILIDFWAQGPRYQRLMLWAIAIVWLLVMVPATVVVAIHMIGRFG